MVFLNLSLDMEHKDSQRFVSINGNCEPTIKHTKFSRTFGKGNVLLTYIPERGSELLPRYLVLN